MPRDARKREARLIGIGEGLSTKVNVNIGTSGVLVDLDMELKKLKAALEHGADTIMDLSTGGDLDSIRRALIDNSDGVPFGTVPAYQAWIEGVG